jgi:hypothetical protein
MVKSVAALSLVLIVLQTQAKGQSSDQIDLQKRVLNEIVDLRADLMEHLLDAQDRKVKELAFELEQVRQGQKRLQEEERQRIQQITEVNQQLASPQLDPPARPQIEALGVQLITERAEKLRIEQAGLSQRESEVIQQLDRETQRGRKLQERARQLRAALGRQ